MNRTLATLVYLVCHMNMVSISRRLYFNLLLFLALSIFFFLRFFFLSFFSTFISMFILSLVTYIFHSGVCRISLCMEGAPPFEPLIEWHFHMEHSLSPSFFLWGAFFFLFYVIFFAISPSFFLFLVRFFLSLLCNFFLQSHPLSFFFLCAFFFLFYVTFFCNLTLFLSFSGALFSFSLM